MEEQKKERNDLPECCRKSTGMKKYKDLINRLNRIEGQIRGVKAMVNPTVTVWIF